MDGRPSRALPLPRRDENKKVPRNVVGLARSRRAEQSMDKRYVCDDRVSQSVVERRADKKVNEENPFCGAKMSDEKEEKRGRVTGESVAHVDDNESVDAMFAKKVTEADASLEGPEAEAYFEHLMRDGAEEGDSGAEMELPPWYDEELFRRGQSYMSKYRFYLKSGMLAGLIAVLAIPSILRILERTRQSSTPATAYRRYVRTILHTQAWFDHPATSAASKFWTSLRSVRRAHMRASRACDRLDIGQITQKDLALTQFGFMGFGTLGAPRVHLDDGAFLEATVHMWRVIGHLLGIKDEYNLCADSWATTQPRLQIVLRRVYSPCLEHTDALFRRMAAAVLEGLWPVNTVLTVDSYIFFTKRLAYVPGYEYFAHDYPPWRRPDPAQHRYYDDLGWWDRLTVKYGLCLVTYLHRYTLVRCYLNFRAWLTDQWLMWLPFIAFWKYGVRWSYVRIFSRNGKEAHDFEFKLKEE